MPTPTTVGAALHALLAQLKEVRVQLEQTQAVLSDLIQERRAGQENYPAQLAYWASERRMTIALLEKFIDSDARSRLHLPADVGAYGPRFENLLTTLKKNSP